MVVLEAMAQGKPVVATTVGENPYVIDNGTTGFLTEPADVSGMTDSLERLLSDQELRGRFGKAGKEKWSQKFGADAMTAGYSGIYNELL